MELVVTVNRVNTWERGKVRDGHGYEVHLALIILYEAGSCPAKPDLGRCVRLPKRGWLGSAEASDFRDPSASDQISDGKFVRHLTWRSKSS